MLNRSATHLHALSSVWLWNKVVWAFECVLNNQRWSSPSHHTTAFGNDSHIRSCIVCQLITLSLCSKPHIYVDLKRASQSFSTGFLETNFSRSSLQFVFSQQTLRNAGDWCFISWLNASLGRCGLASIVNFFLPTLTRQATCGKLKINFICHCESSQLASQIYWVSILFFGPFIN